MHVGGGAGAGVEGEWPGEGDEDCPAVSLRSKLLSQLWWVGG